MNMKEKASEIYRSDISKQEKIHRLQELALDCQNEMDAQEQNMHPEIEHRLSEGLLAAKNYLLELQKSNS